MEKGQKLILSQDNFAYETEADFWSEDDPNEVEPGAEVYLIEVKKIGKVVQAIEWE